MAHVLSTVRAAAVAALTGLPSTGANVSTQDPYPQDPARLPALFVSTSADPVVEEMAFPQVLRWDVQILVGCVAQGTADMAAVLDVIASEVQVALASIGTIGGKDCVITPTSFEAPIFSGEGEQPVARRTIVFTVYSLYTQATAPEVLI